MSKIYLSFRAHPALVRWLRDSGHTLILCGEKNPLPVDPAISHHADLLHCSLGPGKPVFHGEISHLQAGYPAEAIYNACCTGKYFIHKLQCTDSTLLHLAKSAGLEFIDVPQGYTRCSCLPVDETSVITADQGILRACRRAGLRCLEAGPDFVRLPGYPYGFLGGAAGRVGDTILFHGNLNAHPDGPRIRSFIEARNLKCVDFPELPLTDIGSIIEETAAEEAIEKTSKETIQEQL